MTKTIYYNFPGMGMTYGYVIQHSIDDIVDYEYRKRYGKTLDKALMTDDEKSFRRSYQDRWNANDIDEAGYYDFDFDFIDFLRDKYHDIAYDECRSQLKWDCYYASLGNISTLWSNGSFTEKNNGGNKKLR